MEIDSLPSSKLEERFAADNILSDNVINKYKVSADICNNVMSNLIQKCVNGASSLDLCRYGDNQIIEQTANIFRKDKELEKGIAYPTTICVNGIVQSYSPLSSDASCVVLAPLDVVKIELGSINPF
jgi:methionine aminopeptidase